MPLSKFHFIFSDLWRVTSTDPAGVRAPPAPPQEGPQLRIQGEAKVRSPFCHEASNPGWPMK